MICVGDKYEFDIHQRCIYVVGIAEGIIERVFCLVWIGVINKQYNERVGILDISENE